MPQSLARVFVHIVFSTKHRARFIRPEIEKKLHEFLASVCRECGSPPVIINGMEDHVHILCKLSRTIALCDLLEEVKKRSSRWIKTQGRGYGDFAWQNGYGAFSVGKYGLARVREYIANQKAHHRRISFMHEYRATLQAQDVDYDERYIWE